MSQHLFLAFNNISWWIASTKVLQIILIFFSYFDNKCLHCLPFWLRYLIWQSALIIYSKIIVKDGFSNVEKVGDLILLKLMARFQETVKVTSLSALTVDGKHNLAEGTGL